jgi:hypothetical protein
MHNTANDHENKAAVEFLELLRPGGPWVLTAILPDGPTETITAVNAQSVDAFVRKHNGGRNIYFSVNPTRTPLNKNSSKFDIARIEYLPLDLDPNDDERPDDATSRYLQAIKDQGLKVAAIVDSGNGIQALIRLAEPIQLAEPVTNGAGKMIFPPDAAQAITDVEARSKALMERLGSVAGTQNIDRILRLPGTINLPNAKKLKAGRVPCRAKLIQFNGATVTLADLPLPEPSPQPGALDWAMAATVSTPDIAPTGKIDATVEQLVAERMTPERDRSGRFAHAVMSAVERGMSIADFEALCRANPQGCAQKYLPPERRDELRLRIEEVWWKHVVAVAKQNATPKLLVTQKHGAASIERMKWLVRNRLPETGAGLLLGQWGMFKTFVVLNLTAHVMLGWDWTGEPVYRQCGVLAFAPEGAGSIGRRIAAHLEHKAKLQIGEDGLFDPAYPPSEINLDAMPFEWAESCPSLIGKSDPLPVMIATARAAHDRFMREYNLPLGLIWIDTMSTAAGWQSEQDNAEAAAVLAVLRNLSTATKALVMAVDHFGKNVDAGPRGASAKEANADFSLAVLGDKELSGAVKNTRLAIRKLRDGPQGAEIPFEARVVDMGEDERAHPVTSVVIDWASGTTPFRKGEGWSTGTLTLLRKTLMAVLAKHGTEQFPVPDEPAVHAVNQEILRREFYLSYPTEGDAELKQDTRQKAFKRAVKDALNRELIGLREFPDGTTFVWLTQPDDVLMASIERFAKNARRQVPTNA